LRRTQKIIKPDFSVRQEIASSIIFPKNQISGLLRGGNRR
jgi:hypothetical protein